MVLENLVAGVWPNFCSPGVLPCTDDIILWPYAVAICIVAAILIIGSIVMRRRK